MKIPVLFLFLSFTTQLYAQKFELGFNGGLSSNSAPKDFYYDWGEANYKRTISKAFNIRGSYLSGKWRFGIVAELIRIAINFTISLNLEVTYI